jgi:uncharacterized membrane protein YccC
VAGVIVGLVVGFTLIEFVETELTLEILSLAFLFIALGGMGMNSMVFVTGFVAFLALGWGANDPDIANFNTTERLVAEVVALAIALATVWLLGWWTQRREVNKFAEPATTAP